MAARAAADLPLQLKKYDPMHQPCSNTWRVQSQYTDPRILQDNWMESMAEKKETLQLDHNKYCLPPKPSPGTVISEYKTRFKNPKQLKEANPTKKNMTNGQEKVLYSSFDRCEIPKYQQTGICSVATHCNPCSFVMPPRIEREDYNQTQCEPLPSLQTWRCCESAQIPKHSEYPLKGKHPLFGQVNPSTGLYEPNITRREMGTENISRYKYTTYEPKPKIGSYSLFDAALDENRHIKTYTDRFATTPTYAMRCTCNDCSLLEMKDANLLNRWKTSFIRCDAKNITNNQASVYPYSYNGRINWVVPNSKCWCHVTCQ